nr:MAG TPA: AAA domain protein [Caudoviricetes sp.]
MSRAILIYGESGSGKTTSLRTLDPKTTLIIDADRKGLSWRGWKKQYNKENKNYIQTSSVPTIEAIYSKMQSEWADKFDTLVIDGLSTIMVDDEMARAKERGYDKFVDLAQCVWQVVSNAHLLRENLTVIFIAHSVTEHDESGYLWTHVKTGGRKLDKIVLESKFTTVLWAKALDGRHVFVTQADHSTAKSPMGCFDKEIENDMAAVIAALKEYEGEDAKDTAKSA